jgi:AcrR family transcriptional regulator
MPVPQFLEEPAPVPSVEPIALDPRIQRSRAAVLAATADLLIETASTDVTIEGIAERSGVAKTTIYRHWRTRSALVFDAFASLLSAVPPRPEPAPVREQLVVLIAGLIRGLTQTRWAPVVPSLLDAADHDPELHGLVQKFLDDRMEPCREVLRQAIQAGELRADLDVDVAVSQLVGPVFYRRLVSRETMPEGFAVKVVDQFLGGAVSGR